VLACDVEQVDSLIAAGLPAGSVDRVLMNPPFHDVQRHNVSPDPRRRLAHAGAEGLLARWIGSAELLLKPQGTLTLIWRADRLDDVLGTLQPRFGNIAVMPVQPRPGAAPIRVLVRAVKGSLGSRTINHALLLNDEKGQPTDAAEAVLRAGNTLDLTEK